MVDIRRRYLVVRKEEKENYPQVAVGGRRDWRTLNNKTAKGVTTIRSRGELFEQAQSDLLWFSGFRGRLVCVKAGED
jgi:hypothetical protein